MLEPLNNYASYNDEQLFALLSNSDEQAFEELYERYWQKLFLVAAKRLDYQPEAEEVVQDIFFNIWKMRFELQIEKSPAAYLATAVKFQVYNRLSKRRRERRFSLTVLREQQQENNTIDQLRFTELRKLLEQTVNNLPQQCKLVYQLSRDQGYKRKEIAQKLNISEKTVANHLTRALNMLRTILHLLVISLIK